MEKQLQVSLVGKFLLISLLLIFNIITCEGSQEMDQWLRKITRANENLTHLHFYFHDTFSGPNPTAVIVAESNITQKFPTLFGAIVMIDDPLREGPDPASKEVGRAQGLYGSSDQKSMGLAMAVNFVFTSGEFNGSTLTILGQNPATEPRRELPIIGGTGVFRLARGFAELETYYFNASNGNAIVEYNVAVLHY